MEILYKIGSICGLIVFIRIIIGIVVEEVIEIKKKLREDSLTEYYNKMGKKLE